MESLVNILRISDVSKDNKSDDYVTLTIPDANFGQNVDVELYKDEAIEIINKLKKEFKL